MSTPLAVGIDHVSMNISYSPWGSEAIDVILDLAARHGLVIYDPQGDEAPAYVWTTTSRWDRVTK